MGLKGSKTEQNLKDAFAGESQANRRYLYFANKADIEGQNDVAALFRSTAEGETGHAHGIGRIVSRQCGRKAHEQPDVVPQVSHFRQVPLRTSVKLPQSAHGSPS